MAKSVKGTQTEKNLLTSFAGESQARMRYTYFASVAKKEGFEQISAEGAIVPILSAVLLCYYTFFPWTLSTGFFPFSKNLLTRAGKSDILNLAVVVTALKTE